ncbi:MAG TPA: response regulator [Coriobacteriia bacterium]|nr:response regulator [Coriobacteriia bacterium]
MGLLDESALDRHERIEAVLNATNDGLLVLSPEDEVTLVNPAALQMLAMAEDELMHRTVKVEDLLGLDRVESASSESCKDIMSCEMSECPAFDSADLRCWLINGTLCDKDGSAKTFAEKRDKCADCPTHEKLAGPFDPLVGKEHDLKLDNGESHLVLKVRVTPIADSSGSYIGRVVALRDITSEDEIAQMKNEFVSTVSHELRTPLTSIKGYVDLILDGDAGDINEIQREFLAIVKENSDRLVELINDMLDISRIESGRIHLKVDPQHVDEIIDGAVDTFRAVLTQSSRTMQVDVPDDLPVVIADRDRVRQVLINLLSNAIKYSPAGGDVKLIARREGDLVRISVIDQGLGISAEDQSMLFTKFYRVDSALTREIGGTGLGLSICKSIIELLGGEIGVDSVAGEGSTFWFTLPVAPEDAVRMPEIAGPEGRTGTVLVVDSDIEIAALIETYLRRRGFDVLQAHSADDAYSLAIAAKPDVITLDVILEDGDGFDLLHRLKEHESTADIPVVVLSIVCDEGRSCRFGAANYLEKPIDQKKLLDVVGSLVGSGDSPLVLVVDDDRSVVSLLTETLRRRGFSVAQAFDGTEAIAALDEHRPDLILLDLRMPRMNGYEVIKRVKTSEEWGDIPIVVMTAYPIDHAHVDILAQTEGQISKPLSPGDIAGQVEALLAGVPVKTEA